jgi:hypothetical protein
VRQLKVISLTFVLALMIAACSSKPSDEDVDQAYENAQDQLGDSSFEEVGDTSQCTEDCSGHDAGFEWARDQGVTDASECSGDSESFVEGCEAYASAVETQADEDLGSDDE